ncbi:MAG: SusC/RagA family TonB-linked outer membrane protein [Saprospiraceae bacterium]|nr:SusC/RagA family TonB-linked outer membrane protein [Saprospiraceae bacterium]
MKKLYFTVLLACLCTILGAQTVQGIIRDGDSGEPLVGVTILEKGTSNGTISDVDGSYQLTVNNPQAILVYSYTGFQSQEVPFNGQTNLDITMMVGVTSLDEVVVTAIGVSREKKALSYAITNVGGEEISTIKDHNPVNSLVGKVAGVVISQGTGGPGGGSRVVIRGNNSITGNNQPLVVVDGIPIDNSGSNSGGSVYNSTVTGGGITDINPDDIESISVLKGPNAAALYGSRAGNGVLLITTKKGIQRPGIGVSINSNITFDSPMFLPEFQNEYGQGTQGNIPANVTELKQASGSWGPKMDGSSQLYYTGENRAYSAQPNNVADFFRTAPKLINSISLEGGSNTFTSRFSYTNNTTQSMLPNSDLKSHNFNLRSQWNLTNKLTLDAKATYFLQDINNRVSQGSEGVLAYVYYMPRNVRLSDLMVYQNPSESLNSISYSSLGANPYWILEHDRNYNRRERLLSFGKLNYEINSWLSAFVRLGTDVATGKFESVNNVGHHFYPTGRLNFGTDRNTETNADFLLMVNNDFGDKLNLSLNLGGNHSYRTGESQSVFAENFKIPTRAFLSNAGQNIPSYSPLAEKVVNSVYGAASLSYDGFIYLDLTGRNDWSSTLPAANRSYFYPSAGLSFVLTRFIDPNSRYFDFLKVRGNWAEVGNDTGPYQIFNYYNVAQDGYLGRTTLSRPNVKFSDDLKPESIKSLEFGIEAKAFNNRAFLDLSWYNIQSTDLIFDVPVPASTGYSYFRENVGQVTNKGIEFLIGGTPVVSNNFSWEITANYSRNKNTLDELLEDLDSYTLNTTNSGNVSIQATVGGGYGDILGTTWKTNDEGQIVVNAEGLPLASSERVLLGNSQPKWTGGLTNTLTYKDISLRFLIDARIGGQIYSSTNASLDGAGVSTNSLQYREDGVVVDGVIEQDDGTYVPNTNKITAQRYWGAYSGIASNYVYDQDNIRLREVAIGYNLPGHVLNGSFVRGASISFIGRNLFFLKKSIPDVDPEALLGTGNNGMGILSNNLPTIRTLGFNINLKF